MSTFVEFTKPTMMPGGGVAGSGENIGFDPTTAANFIASGVAGSSSGYVAPTPPAVQRVKITGTQVMANNSPPIYGNGEICTFLAPISAALIAAGLAVSN